MGRESHISNLIGLAQQTEIPFWCFEVGLGLRLAISYPETNIEQIKEDLLYLGGLGHGSEQYYAMAKRHSEVLLEWAEKAETGDEIDYVISNCSAFSSPGADIIADKNRKLRRPDTYLAHERSLKGLNARRTSDLQLATTVDTIAEVITSHAVIPEGPTYDTVTLAAKEKYVAIAKKLSELKWIYDMSLTQHHDLQPQVARRVYELWQKRELVM